MTKETFTVNALSFTDIELKALSIAAILGLMSGKGINSFLQGGALIIDCLGREEASARYPKGLLFELTPNEITAIESQITLMLVDIGKFISQSDFEVEKAAIYSKIMQYSHLLTKEQEKLDRLMLFR